MHQLQRLLAWLPLFLLLAACGSTTAGAPGTSVPVLERLPTVTPVQPTTPPAVAASATPAPVPTPTATPTAPAVVMSEEGPITPSMAQLQLDGERYAALGDPNAPITIVEFSDFGCPSCRVFALLTFPELRQEYIDTGKVYYVYKDLPIVSPKGDLAAQAAECAGEQGHYWDMHYQLFYLDAAEWNRSTEEALDTFRRVAADIELDAAELEQCVVAGRYASDIARDFEEAQALRLFATPAFFINGKLLTGAHPIEVFDEILSEELAGQ